MVPIHKKSKDQSNTDSYRPISLTSCVGKLMERLINSGLVWHLEKRNIITQEQTGFWQHRSTEDQVTYVAQQIEDGFQDKQNTLKVKIDIDKAYDEVWRDELLKYLTRDACTYQWISKYLTNMWMEFTAVRRHREKESPGRCLQSFLIPCLHQRHRQRHAL